MSSKRFQLVLAIALALVMMAPGVAAYAANGAVPTTGELCVDGLVIDWEEEPLEQGWYIEATPTEGAGGDPIIAVPDEDEGEEGQFKFDEDDLADFTKWTFTIVYSDTVGVQDNDHTIGLEGNWSGVTPTSLDVEFEADAMKCARIRFKLRETVTVIATKIDADHNLLEDWTIVATPGKDNYFAEEWEGETVSGTVTFDQLTPGLWIFSEAPPDADEVDWDDFSPVIPVTGKQELEIKGGSEDGYTDTIEIRFKNMLNTGGCIDVTKVDDTGFGLSGWEISVLKSDGSEVVYGYTDPTGKIKFEGLDSGPYTVVEEVRSGWATPDVAAYDVMVQDNEDCAVVEFLNIQAEDAYCIEGTVVDANGHYGLAGWIVEATPVDKNGYELITDTFTTTAPFGQYEFSFVDENGEAIDDYRLSGGTYKVCVIDDNDPKEDDVNGWLPHTKECFQARLPEAPSKTCTMLPKFVYQQVGHSESGKEAASSSSSMSWSGGSSMGSMSGGSNMSGGNMGGGEMMQPMKPMQPEMEMKCSTYHTAQKGEGLYEIGAKYMMPAGAMLMANPTIAERPNKYVAYGEKVCIP